MFRRVYQALPSFAVFFEAALYLFFAALTVAILGWCFVGIVLRIFGAR